MQLRRPFATVAPTVDGHVLVFLAKTDGTFMISQVQRILVTASGEGVRKLLTRLTTQGVVQHNRVGRTHTYCLSTELLAAEPIMALSQMNSIFREYLDSIWTGGTRGCGTPRRADRQRPGA